MNTRAVVFIFGGIPIIHEAQLIFMCSLLKVMPYKYLEKRKLYVNPCQWSTCGLFRGQFKCVAGPETASFSAYVQGYTNSAEFLFLGLTLWYFILIHAQQHSAVCWGCEANIVKPPLRNQGKLQDSSVQSRLECTVVRHGAWNLKCSNRCDIIYCATLWGTPVHLINSCEYAISPTQGRNSMHLCNWSKQ